MLKRLVGIKEGASKVDLTIGKLYDIIESGFLCDSGDYRYESLFIFEEAPNKQLAHADIRKAQADGWNIEVLAFDDAWYITRDAQFHKGKDYRVAPSTPSKTANELKKEELQAQLTKIQQELTALEVK